MNEMNEMNEREARRSYVEGSLGVGVVHGRDWIYSSKKKKRLKEKERG